MFFILPDQLFEKLPKYLNEKEHVVLFPHSLYFDRYNYNKNKLLLHHASMLNYRDQLKDKSIRVTMINYRPRLNFKHLVSKIRNKELRGFYIPNKFLMNELITACKKYKVKLILYKKTPYFLNRYDEMPTNVRIFNSFYIKQRKKFDILMKNGKPVGGKWSYDKYNQDPYRPMKINCPSPKINNNKYISDGKQFVNKHFKNNYGSMDNFIFPINSSEAKKLLRDFLHKKLNLFGKTQDWMDPKNPYFCHSLLSSSLNIGILTPGEILKEIKKIKGIKINSLEGYIRQIFWREFCFYMYINHAKYKGNICIVPNKLGFKKKIKTSFYDGTTGVKAIDYCINKALQTGYLHHIERLMFMGNFLNLCQFHPQEIFTWFSELVCIDGGSTDVFMYMNILMCTYCAAGEPYNFVTKPYISSYNYIKKMSSLNDAHDANVWKALYWTFINDNQDLIKGRGQYLLQHLPKYIKSGEMKEFYKVNI